MEFARWIDLLNYAYTSILSTSFAFYFSLRRRLLILTHSAIVWSPHTNFIFCFRVIKPREKRPVKRFRDGDGNMNRLRKFSAFLPGAFLLFVTRSTVASLSHFNDDFVLMHRFFCVHVTVSESLSLVVRKELFCPNALANAAWATPGILLQATAVFREYGWQCWSRSQL